MVVFLSLPDERYESGVAELASNKIWVTRGCSKSSSYLDSTLVYENGEWTDGPVLPEGLEEHCMAKVDEDTIILAGGENRPSYADNVYLFDIASETWTEINSMPLGPRHGHSCGIAQ